MYECHSLIASCEVIIVDELTLSSIISRRSLDSFAFSGVTAYAGTIRTASRFTSGHSAGVDSDS